MAISKLQTLRDFFEPPKVTMDELKALSKELRHELAILARDEMIRRGTHKPEDFEPFVLE